MLPDAEYLIAPIYSIIKQNECDNLGIRIIGNKETPSIIKIITYKFINAYPISINSIPVSYDSSQLLKCTVSFTYSRYVISRTGQFSTATGEPQFSSDISQFGQEGFNLNGNPLQTPGIFAENIRPLS